MELPENFQIQTLPQGKVAILYSDLYLTWSETLPSNEPQDEYCWNNPNPTYTKTQESTETLLKGVLLDNYSYSVTLANLPTMHEEPEIQMLATLRDKFPSSNFSCHLRYRIELVDHLFTPKWKTAPPESNKESVDL